MEKSLMPTDINAFLATKVLGQVDLLRRISVSLYKHINGLPAPNVLLIAIPHGQDTSAGHFGFTTPTTTWPVPGP
jgi:hypothetical protein